MGLIYKTCSSLCVTGKRAAFLFDKCMERGVMSVTQLYNKRMNGLQWNTNVCVKGKK